MFMEEKGVFRSALGGFHKQDVLNYIDEITAAWAEERTALTAQAEAAEQQTVQAQEALQAQQKATAEAIQQLEQQLAEATAKLAELTTAVEEAAAANAALQNRLTEVQAQAAAAAKERLAAEERLEAKGTALEKVEAQLTNQQKKLNEYAAALGHCDNVAEHVGELVRPIVQKADAQAVTALTEAEAALQNILEAIAAAHSDVLRKRQAMQNAAVQNESEIKTALQEWQEKANKLADSTPHFFR